MYTNLDHLSSEKVDELKKRYYQGASVYQLMSENDIYIAPSAFYTLLPPDPVKNYGCSRCKVNLVTATSPRSKQEPEKDPKQYYCPVCGRKPFVEKSGWFAFPYLSDEEREKRRKQIEAYYGDNPVSVEYESLSLILKIYLAALCKALLSKDRVVIRPLYESKVMLASTAELQKKIYTDLLENGIISVNPESSLDAFDIASKRFPQKYDRDKVSYILNVTLHKGKHTFSNPVENISSIIRNNTEPEIVQLWKEIAVGECITYLQYRFGKIGFSFHPGEKTKEVFQKLLENFSVSQIYYIIWCKVNDASRWYLEGGVSKQRAANSVISACQRYGENALFYERDIPQYQRPSDCPRSILTQYFYYEVLKSGQQADNISLCKTKAVE